MSNEVIIIGGGLAGCEAAWQAAELGCKVKLYEMRPKVETGAHVSGDLAELICSNSLGSNLPDRAAGVLKEELRALGSHLIKAAEETQIAAGTALAVDRTLFARQVTRTLEQHPNISIIREEVTSIPSHKVVILASGPLTSPSLSNSLSEFCGRSNLYFFDAISPIIDHESIDMDIAYTASRWDDEEATEGDYINLPFHNKQDYLVFYKELINAQRIELREFEKSIEQGVDAGHDQFFEGCLPVEIIAQRGEKALLFGPMRPVGLKDPRVERPPYAVVQLRRENHAGSMYNMVGFQTNLTFPEQRRVLRLIPGLANAEFSRYGQMHRNTFISAPEILRPTLQTKNRADLFMAGQITGVEGYAGNIATGLLAGINAARFVQNKEMLNLPNGTMLGALLQYITTTDSKTFQPMKANFGILPSLNDQEKKGSKRDRAFIYAQKCRTSMEEFLQIYEK